MKHVCLICNIEIINDLESMVGVHCTSCDSSSWQSSLDYNSDKIQKPSEVIHEL